MNRKRFTLITALGSFIALAAAVPVAPDARAQGSTGRGIRVQRADGRDARAARRDDAPRGKEDERARALVEEGLRHADDGKWDEALRAYRQAVEVDPRYSDAYLNMGDAYMTTGRYKEGFAAYRQAIAAAPSNADAFYSLGAAYNDMGQHGDAFKPFVTAINLRPDFAEAHYGIGFAYLRLENFRDALPYLRRAVRLMPDYADAHLALGQTYVGLRDAKAAEAELKILADLDASAARELEKEMRVAASVAREPASPRPSQEGGAPLKQETAAPVRREASTPAAVAYQGQESTEVSPAVPIQKEPPPPTQRPTPAAPVAEASQPSRSESLLTVELRFWDSVKNSSDPEEFAAYLKKYPRGQFVDLARIRARALNTRAAAASGPEAAPRPSAEPPSSARPNETATVSRAEPPAAEKPQPPTVEKAEPVTPTPTPTPAPTPVPTPAPTPVPTPEEATTTEAALSMLRDLFPARFTYRAAKAGPPPATSEVRIDYEPLQFGGCRIEWKDSNDTLMASLAEVEAESVKVTPRARPGTTFSRQVWDVSIASVGGVGAFTETKGDGSGTVNRYNGLDLQYDDRAKAERVAAALRRAVEFCTGKVDSSQ
jgi:tetratricopeptide (TPR) repeat protein